MAKGLENLRKAYRELGYINFTSIPNTTFDEDKKLVILSIDIDEGKQFYVRRIEFAGNTTTRDKVIRREIALEEGQVYDERLWKLSLLRLNQLGYFEQLKPDDPNVTETPSGRKERHGRPDPEGEGEGQEQHRPERRRQRAGRRLHRAQLQHQQLPRSGRNPVGPGQHRQQRSAFCRSALPSPTCLIARSRAALPCSPRSTTTTRRGRKQFFTGQQINLPNAFLNNLQNYTQSSTGFTASLSYPLHHSFKRVGITYSFDRSSIVAVSDASKILFTDLAFRGISGPNSLDGIITSKILPSFSFNTIDSPISPKRGTSLFLGGEIAGLGGTVRSIRPIVQYKHFNPMQKGRNTIGFNVQGSFLAGYGGVVAPPFQRFYLGGENDIRGFDIRSVSPVAFLPDKSSIIAAQPGWHHCPQGPGQPAPGQLHDSGSGGADRVPGRGCQPGHEPGVPDHHRRTSRVGAFCGRRHESRSSEDRSCGSIPGNWLTSTAPCLAVPLSILP